MKNFDKMTAEAMIAELSSGKINVNELDLHKTTQREAFKEILIKRPNILKEVAKENCEHFIKFALDIDPRYFIYLKPEQYTDEFAQMYLAKRFEESERRGSNEQRSLPVVIQKSLDNKMIFSYSYATEEGGELYYLDPELKVPVSIKSSFKISIKLVNAVMLINKLDINIAQLGAQTIYSTITELIVGAYNSYLNSYIKEKNVGYYTLCSSFDDIADGFTQKLNKKLDQFGLIVCNFKLSNLAIPKEIQYKLEDQAFAIRKHKADVEADAEMAKISLEGYEAKLAIQQKYPDADHSLTEYEKDLALKRYLVKNGRHSEISLDHNIEIDRKGVVADAALNKKADVIPEIAPKSGGNGALIATIIIGSILTLIGFASGVAMGVIFMVATIVTASIIGIAKSSKSKAAVTEPDSEKVPASEPSDSSAEACESEADTLTSETSDSEESAE